MVSSGRVLIPPTTGMAEDDAVRKVARLRDMQSAMSPGKERETACDVDASGSSGIEGKVTLDAIKGLLKDTL